jgi:hypothetical protein
VTSRKDQEKYWARKDQPYRFVTVNEFAEAFQSLSVGRRVIEELSIPFDKTKNHPAALVNKKYGAGKMDLLKANFSREYLLMKRNSFVYIFKIFQVIIDSHYNIQVLFTFKFCIQCDSFSLRISLQ